MMNDKKKPQLPQGSENAQFGKKVQIDQNAMKNIFNTEVLETRDLPPPNAQKSRGYNVDLNKIQLGQKSNLDPDYMKYVFNHDFRPDEVAQTKFVQKPQEDMRNYQNYDLGKPKNLNNYNPNLQNVPAGQNKKKKEVVTAADCFAYIQTEVKQLQPDKDLGKPVGKGWQNEPRQGDENRIFGNPTIRTDLKKVGQPSVADKRVYQQDSVANCFQQQDYVTNEQLKAKKQQQQKQEQQQEQEQYQQQPLDQDEVNNAIKVRKGKLEIRSAFANIGYEYDDSTFEKMYKQAIQVENSKDNKVSLQTFMTVISS